MNPQGLFESNGASRTSERWSRPEAPRNESGELFFRRLLDWAKHEDRVRAAVLHGSRAQSGVVVDRFSDYDVFLEAQDARSFVSDDHWLREVGAPLVVLHRSVTDYAGFAASALIAHFENGTKLDLTFVERGFLGRLSAQARIADELDHGYRVLVDKDEEALTLPPPTCAAFRLAPPDERAYRELIAKFYDALIVAAQAMWRGNLPAAKQGLDRVAVGEGLVPLLQWKLGTESAWSEAPRANGRDFWQRLDAETFAAFELTYAGGGRRANWEALWAARRLFRRVAKEVGEALGYADQADLHRRIVVELRILESQTL